MNIYNKNDIKIKTLHFNTRNRIFQGLSVHGYRAVRQSKGIKLYIQKQTDVSAFVRNPLFTTNCMIFDLPSNMTLQGVVIVIFTLFQFVAHVLMQENEPGYSR